MKICYYISGKLNKGVFNNKEFCVLSNDKTDAKERLEDCLNLNEEIEDWRINKTEVIDSSVGLKEKDEHMRGVWYEPF